MKTLSNHIINIEETDQFEVQPPAAPLTEHRLAVVLPNSYGFSALSLYFVTPKKLIEMRDALSAYIEEHLKEDAGGTDKV